MYETNSGLAAKALSAGYAAELVLKELNLELSEGSITAVIGANGSGKSTLLKALARKLSPTSGAVFLDGVSLATLSKTEVQNSIAVLSQQPAAKSTDTVFDFVARGAVQEAGISRVSPRIKQEVETLLGRVGLLKVRDDQMLTLSGGAKQRAQIAAALVRGPKVLLLDEPTTSLDYSHQLEVINLLSSLKRERGMTVVVVIHDLNLVARFADRVLILKSGELVADGTPEEVITPANLADAFSILARVITDPVGKTPLVIPIRQLD